MDQQPDLSLRTLLRVLLFFLAFFALLWLGSLLTV